MDSKEHSTGKSFSYKDISYKYSVLARYILFLFLVVLFYATLAPKILPERYDIRLGSYSEKEITAPVQIPNSKATLNAQEKAAEQVQSIYSIIPIRNETLIVQILDRIDGLNQDDQVSNQDKVSIYRQEIPQRAEDFVENFVKSNRNLGTYSDKLLDEMIKVISQQIYAIPEETFIKIPRLTSEDIQEMKPVAREIVSRLSNDQIVDGQTARAKVAELVSTSSLRNKIPREIVQELARVTLTANKFYDEEATKEAQVAARENTETVYIKQGDILVSKGQLITEELYTLLDENKLLKNEVNYWPQIGLLMFSLLLTLGLHLYIRQSSTNKYKYDNSQLLMLVLIFIITVVSMSLVSIVQDSIHPYVGYLAPVALGAILVTLLMDSSLAFFCAMLFSILSSIILNVTQGQIFDFHFGFFTMVVSFVAISVVHKASQRSTLLKGGIMVSLFGSITVFVLILIDGTEWSQVQTLYTIAFAFMSGLLTSVFVIGLMPFFEVTFGILSALKLVELSNPNHPLLRKLLTETPGTYHHSVMVGNLSEAAAEAIGANGLLCRVGSYYHDIGKTKRPNYFIENQNHMENPHDTLDPKMSKSIIIAHARDGVEMLKTHKLPKLIRDIAEQHHGTTFLHFFYHKALKKAEEQGVEPDFTDLDFRYPGPKAQSKESAIVGIADSVEAAVRSLRNPTVEQVESMIEKIIKGRMDDHQFNDCDLTLKELDIISKTLKESVMGIFHSRIEYPEEIKKTTNNHDEADKRGV
ncbi:HD family phosphohydrolase [Paenibacillus crassostreae]|uniref:Metal-dependent phosphohydrolase n=1 Tax=Paenibacillus crassostreae TaxID=1763538 RepID=A0A167C2N8_9BACL|nr:HDIG domain-containing metalloprotein [Paenibacillus crassostreae]AOZ91721.1 metal-dependent phosphohydrolase [Paenibacillus crassostreae]OAB72706.1 metal-dependent phosphohydrolase [Paenibacillus crassostreae]